ncbi:unnamed protein product [Macrosiphum euphorbiae]|uniref:Uncharacterized protein n=1 Tax=Macrosiphum euphorbiae TaxID=13131 RepID=A0AAV0Y2F2_9HEMI|nr:unnamed protein product [Macrosiphum euphorbiae]
MAGYTNKFFKYWYNSSIIEDYLTILTNENPTSHFFSVDFLKKYCEGLKGKMGQKTHPGHGLAIVSHQRGKSLDHDCGIP